MGKPSKKGGGETAIKRKETKAINDLWLDSWFDGGTESGQGKAQRFALKRKKSVVLQFSNRNTKDTIAA